MRFSSVDNRHRREKPPVGEILEIDSILDSGVDVSKSSDAGVPGATLHRLAPH